MPCIEVKRDEINFRLGKIFSISEFEHLCFEFGLELENVTSCYEKLKKRKRRKNSKN